MKVLICSSEIAPLAKTGGLADVAGALPLALHGLKHDVRAVLPRYRQIDREKLRQIGDAIRVRLGAEQMPVTIGETAFPRTPIPVYCIDQPGCFDRESLYQVKGEDYTDNLERFALFCRAVVDMLPRLGWYPDVIHCNDWQTGLIPVFLKYAARRIPTVFTIHNLAYQGVFPKERFNALGLDRRELTPEGLEFYGKLSLIKGGLAYADVLTTVSPTYAKQIQTPDYGAGLDGLLRARASDLTGIINGIDQEEWNPETDAAIAANYTPRNLSGKQTCKASLQRELALPVTTAPLIGIITRLTDQKGIDLVVQGWEALMATRAQFVILGTGEPRYHELLSTLVHKYQGQAALNLTFDVGLSHRIEAGADMFLMPSRFEPCGLNQMYSLRYGTVPIVRKTGGLADTVVDTVPTTFNTDTATGFVFESYTATALVDTVKRAVTAYRQSSLWRQLMETGMRQDFSWTRSANEYVRAYERAIAKRVQAVAK